MLTTSDVTISGNTASYGGGGVYVDDDGTFTATNTMISGNTAPYGGGVDNYGTCTATNSTFSGNKASDGGGVYNKNRFTATNTTFSGNTASYGGGVDNYGTCTATNSTFSGNKASYGGGVYNKNRFTATNTTISGNTASYGGGVDNYGTCTATNSTISGNEASDDGGGVYVDNYGTFTATNVTIAGNSANRHTTRCSGGVYVCDDGTFTATNVLISANYNSNISGSLSSASSNNFIGYYPGFVCEPVFDEYGKLTNSDSMDLHLRSDSGAIDAGSNDVIEGISTDLDGKTRVYNKTVDIGAYEYQGDRNDTSNYSTVVTTLNDSFDLNDDEWSLREAVYYAPRYETITFDKSLSGTIDLTHGELTLDKALMLDGDGRIVIDAGQKSRVMRVTAGTTEKSVVLRNLTLQNGKTTYGSGGGIYLNGVLNASNVIISRNISQFGGGVYVYGNGSFTATNVMIAGNSASSRGGGVHVSYNSEFTTINSTISDNNACYGGGVDVFGNFTASNTMIAGNRASNPGGGVYASGSFTASNVTISGNTSGVYFFGYDASEFTAINTVVSRNYGSNIWGSPSSRSSNNLIDGDPLFVCGPVYDENGNLTNSDSLDLRLQNNSPAIDAGSNDAVVGTETDLEGKPRVYNGTVDIGAYEYQGDEPHTIPEAPGELVFGDYERTTQSVFLDWTDNSSNELNFRVEISTDGGENWTLAGTPEEDATSIALSGLGVGNYIVRVRAENLVGASDWATAELVLATPEAPGELTFGLYDRTTQSVLLNWVDNSSNETGFRVEISVDGENWTFVETTEADATSTTLNLVYGVYSARVRAENPIGESDWTILTARLDDAFSPYDLTLDDYDASARTVAMHWTDASDFETGFRVEYSTDGGKTWRLSQIMNANATSRVAWSVKPDARYEFRVCALKDGEQSCWAYSKTLDTGFRNVAAPGDLTLGDYDATTRTVAMNWQDNSDNETGFRVEYSLDDGKTWFLSQVMNADTTSRVAWNVRPNAQYKFRVCALKDGEQSYWAFSKTLNTSVENVAAPGDLTLGVYDAATRTVAMSWQDNSNNETGFRVEYSLDDGKTWRFSQIMSADATERVAWNVRPNAQYRFRVCAFQGNVRSAWTYSGTLNTNIEIAESLKADAALILTTGSISNVSFDVSNSGEYALTLPIAVPRVKQALIQDVFEDASFLRFDSDVDLTPEQVVNTRESELFVDLFDDESLDMEL